MQIKLLDSKMNAPEYLTKGYATKGSVGMDLYACTFNGNSLESFSLLPGHKVKVGTGIALNMNNDMFVEDENGIGLLGAFLLPRSGLGTKHDLVLANTIGVIDNDYQGEVIAFIKNNSTVPYVITQYDKVAQLCVMPFIKPTFKVVTEFSQSSARGSNGFGSTGT